MFLGIEWFNWVGMAISVIGLTEIIKGTFEDFFKRIKKWIKLLLSILMTCLVFFLYSYFQPALVIIFLLAFVKLAYKALLGFPKKLIETISNKV